MKPLRMIESFNTQPPEGGCGYNPRKTRAPPAVSTHSRPKAAAIFFAALFIPIIVSTHSRPKAAAYTKTTPAPHKCCFNTQPPEGGCRCEGSPNDRIEIVSTHSRPKAAASPSRQLSPLQKVSTHSRPKAAAPYIKKQEKSVY